MKENTRDFFKIELEHFDKASEVQFNHFMGVFYFWIAVVSIPATAGLLTADNFVPKYIGYLSLIIAILGHFLSAKMFDIRCSQLNYIAIINNYRHYLYMMEKENLPNNHKHPYPRSTNLRNVAFKDFGIYMAIIMSGLDALFFGVGVYIVQGWQEINVHWWAFGLWFLIGISVYIWFVCTKVRQPQNNTD